MGDRADRNEKDVRRGYDAFARGDTAVFPELFAADATWTHQGHSQVAGDHTGLEAILGFFGRSMELSQGTLKIEVDDVVANDDRAFVMAHHTANANGRVLDDHQIHVFEIGQDGRVLHVTQYLGDQVAVDAFWG
jgi:uncharacterized protein